MIRITAGKFRSRKLITPDTLSTKPTMDRVREGVFSALAGDINNSTVLDLFAGSGSYGFEALSRGASYAYFVENTQLAIKSIDDNIKTLKVQNDCKIVQADSLSFINNNKEKYDIIFVDPPYKAYDYHFLVEQILSNELLKPFGIIVLESEDDLDIDESRFTKVKKYKYGLAKIYMLRK